jgi:hypothetical protein
MGFLFFQALPTLWSFVHSSDKIEVRLQSRLEFWNIYFSDFDDVRVSSSKISFQEPWPEKLSGLLKFRFFGLHPHAWLKIYNASNQPTTVSYIIGYMSFNGYSDTIVCYRYNERDFDDQKWFPLYLESQKEVIVIVRIPWPISGSMKNKLPQLTPDSMYTAKYLATAYLSSMGQGVMGGPDEVIYSHILQEAFVRVHFIT